MGRPKSMPVDRMSKEGCELTGSCIHAGKGRDARRHGQESVMGFLLLTLVGLLVSTQSTGSQQAGSSLTFDFDFFRTRVQPIFTTKRPGNARCVSCHAFGTTMQLQPLSPDAATWSEEQSRKNRSST
jgi:hypothetical protein